MMPSRVNTVSSPAPDGINVDHKRAADLLAVLGQEGLHARVAGAAGAQTHEPDVVAEKGVIVHGQDGVAQVLVGGGSGVGARRVLAGRGVCGGDKLGGRVGRAGLGSLGGDAGGGGLVLDEPQAGARWWRRPSSRRPRRPSSRRR